MVLNRYIDLAIREAEKSACHHRLGCVAISNGQVVSKAFNRYKNVGKDHYRRGESTFHAEEIALHRTGSSTIDSLVVVRITSSGLSMACPCKRCLAHMRRCNVTTIFYTDWNGNVQKVRI